MDSFEFRKPRPDIPILPQSALYRTQPLTPFKAPKGRKGRKPRGQKLKPRDLSQFNKFHSEAARNKERDRAEQERVDKIRERDEARSERSGRLLVEDRRYAAKVITDARDRAAERDFRREQLRLLRQQAAAPPPVINIAPAPINIQQPDIQVRPVINLPQGGGEGREEARRFAAFREQVQGDIRRGLGGLQEEIERIGQAQRGGLTPEQSGRLIADRQIRELEERTAQREREREERTAAQFEQLREEAVQRARDEEGLRAAQAQLELLQQTQQRQQELEAASEERIRATQRQAQRQLEEAAGARGEAEQELTRQLSRAFTRTNEAEDRARAQTARAEELERHNQTLREQRRSPQEIAPLKDGSVFQTQEDRDEEIAERFSEQYRGLVLRQATREQRGDRQFLARLDQFQEGVEKEYKFPLPQEGEEISDEDRPFYLNPYRPENEKFLREQLAESRVIQGGLTELRGQAGIKTKIKLTQQQIDREIEVVKRLEREEQRRRLGRGQIQPEVFRGFSSSSEEEEIDLGLEAARARAFSRPPAGGRESPREQAQRQALERQSSQEKVKRVLTEPEPEADSLDSSLESLESEQDNWELVKSNFEAGNQTQFHLKGKPHQLNPQLSHFTFRDDEGWVGKGQSQGRFKGEDLVIVNVNPKDGNVKVRKKDAMREGEKRQRKDVEGNIQYRYLQSLRENGEINLQEIDHTLQPLSAEQPSMVGRAAGAAATFGGVVGNAALGAARGVGGAVYDRLPSAADIGEAAGRGGVAVASGVAGVVRGAVQTALSPRPPAIGEQTGGQILPAGLGRVEDTDEI
jgi:hypothetical protein